MIVAASARSGAPRPGARRRSRGHQRGRHLLHGQRDPDAPGHAGGRQLPAPGARAAHRRRRRDGGRRAVRDAVAAPGGGLSPHQGRHHLAQGPHSGRRARRVRSAQGPRGCARPSWSSPSRPSAGATRRESRSREHQTDLVAGFTNDNLPHYLGGRFRSGYRPLIDAVAAGRVRGVVGVVGCNTVRYVQDQHHLGAGPRACSRTTCWCVQTGCSAIASAKVGLLRPEAALEHAGPGLREVCEAVGIPPVLHLGQLRRQLAHSHRSARPSVPRAGSARISRSCPSRRPRPKP